MKKLIPCILLLLPILIHAQEVGTITGLWHVIKVSAGGQTMTPNARWIAFDANRVQRSGNGWMQHSVGTWEMTGDQLTIVNTNGLDDPFGAFTISLTDSTMQWDRTEEGQNIRVDLMRAEDLPMTDRDRLMGLWQLERSEGESSYIQPGQSTDNASFFVRWDGKFDLRISDKRIRGVYNVHGHKPQLELIPYGDEWDRTYWSVKFTRDQLILELLGGDDEAIMTFERIRQFPE